MLDRNIPKILSSALLNFVPNMILACSFAFFPTLVKITRPFQFKITKPHVIIEQKKISGCLLVDRLIRLGTDER